MNHDILETQLSRRLRPGYRAETAESVIERVASSLAEVERIHGGTSHRVEHFRREFRRLMEENIFWPSGRILNNAGSRQQQLASCFVLPMDDAFDCILDSLCVAARCHRTGGGTGFDFSKLRERNAPIASSEAAGSSGPIPWLRLLDAETTAVMSGGKMRGANLGALSVYHPDIFEFMRAKDTVGDLMNFNLSVTIDDRFMESMLSGDDIDLVSSYDLRAVRRLPAEDIWEELAAQAWKTGDPGILFIDTINRENPLLRCLGPIRTSNPCGEQMLYSHESSILGSINLASLQSRESGLLDWDELARTVEIAVRLLDNAVDLCRYPDPRIENMTKANRRLGLGVMGYADVLVRQGQAYDSQVALEASERIASFIHQAAWDVSSALAAERGPFPNYHRSSFEREVRNCAVTSIAPTGTISMIANCSSGIEPRFAPYYRKDVISEDGIEFIDTDLLAAIMRELKISSAEAQRLIATVPIDRIGLSPQRIAPFRYSHDIPGEWHVDTVGRWQKSIDNGISKTVNLPETATPEEVGKVFVRAWSSGCKGISVYRSGSRTRDLYNRTPLSGSHESRQSKHLAQA